LGIDNVDPDPLVQFGRWLAEAGAAEGPDATAMVLATVDDEGRPSARAVLLKSVVGGASVLFTIPSLTTHVHRSARPSAAALASPGAGEPDRRLGLAPEPGAGRPGRARAPGGGGRGPLRRPAGAPPTALGRPAGGARRPRAVAGASRPAPRPAPLPGRPVRLA